MLSLHQCVGGVDSGVQRSGVFEDGAFRSPALQTMDRLTVGLHLRVSQGPVQSHADSKGAGRQHGKANQGRESVFGMQDGTGQTLDYPGGPGCYAIIVQVENGFGHTPENILPYDLGHGIVDGSFKGGLVHEPCGNGHATLDSRTLHDDAQFVRHLGASRELRGQVSQFQSGKGLDDCSF